MKKSFSEIFYKPVVFNQVKRTVWPPSWLGHTPFAFWLMDVLRPDIVVELGTHTGNSFSSFCQAANFLKTEPKCFAVDTWEGDPHAGMYGEEVMSELSLYIKSNYPERAKLIQSTFNDALDQFQDGSIDLLNIDGYHTYEATKENFENWLPKVSKKGIILLHDTNVFSGDFGAWKLWDEIKTTYPSFSFLHGHGLGVVAVGSEVNKNLESLFSKDEDQISEIRSFFSNLGSVPELKAFNENLTQKISDLETRSEGITTTLKHQAAKITSLIGEAEKAGAESDKVRCQINIFKRPLELDLEATPQEIEIALIELIRFKIFVKTHVAPDLETALKKLESLGQSNLEGLGFRSWVQRCLGQTTDEAQVNLDQILQSREQYQRWQLLFSDRLSGNLEEAEKMIDHLFEIREEMGSRGHRTVKFVNRKIGSVLSR